jgi:hypothetical protein
MGGKILPKRVKPFFRRYFIKEIRDIYTYYSQHTPDLEIQEILSYLPQTGLVAFPYPWVKTDEALSIETYFDEGVKLPYVILDDKKLYYPRGMSDEYIRKKYYAVQKREQHNSSPHRYLTPDFNISEDDIVVDCGVAEGNFSLAIVDQVKKIYLFEPEEQWMEPLRATFAPWKNKIVIVQKFISDKSDENTVTLDEYFAGKDSPTFCKMDVEGYEERVLNGSKRLLDSGKLKKIVTCTYHYADAEENLGKILRSYDYITTPSTGYMLFSLYDELKPPYFRRGLLRCVKQ